MCLKILCGMKTLPLPCSRVYRPCVNIWLLVWKWCPRNSWWWNMWWLFNIKDVEAQRKGSKGKNTMMRLCQDQVGGPYSYQGIRTYFYCGKSDHSVKLCSKVKNKNRENAEVAKGEDEFALAMQHGALSRSICKWIINLGATKHMILHKAAFDTYKLIFLTMYVWVMIKWLKPWEWNQFLLKLKRRAK